MQETEYINVYGARVHNLKDIDAEIPRNSLTVITGLSGSGKSSLAFDTIFAEGQRRYIETFSAYARNFLGNLERPDVDKITGLSPVISIEQKTTNKNPRSTVGTTTEIYDYLRLLYARAGIAYSYLSGEEMVKYTEEQILDLILKDYKGKKIYLLAPLVRSRKGHYKELFEQVRKKGYLYVRIDGELREVTHGMKLDRYKNHDIEVVIDKLIVADKDDKRLKQSVATAMRQGDGLLMILDAQTENIRHYSKRLMCPVTGLSYREPAPHNFSFNSPQGACPKCKGLGVVNQIDVDKVIPDRELSTAPGQDVRFSYEKMDASWNFINKIWNISRYILMNNEGLTLDVARENVAKVAAGQAGNVTDRWILHNLNETIGKVTENFDKFEFGVAGHILYNFIWDEFADWYVELTKEVLYSDNEDEKVITRSVLLYTLDQILRLLHPIMPFVTEEIFGQISEGSIVTAEYPVVRPEFENEEAAAGVEALKDVIRSVRNSRAEVNVAPSKPITILIKTSDSKLDAFFNDNINYIKRFTNPEHLEIAADVEVPDLVMSSIITGAEIYLPLADLLNVEEELARLEKELAKWQKELDMVGKKLSNERFVANAKPEVVQKERDKQKDYQAKYDAIVVRIDEMKKLVK